MIQTYADLKNTTTRLNQIIDAKPAHIQKIFSSAYTLGISIRIPGKTLVLGLGRGKKVEGMWISEKNIPSELRVQDKFLAYLRSNLCNSVLVEVNIDTKDRIIELVYQKWGQKNSFFLFYNKKALNFVNYAYQHKKESFFYLKSWENKPVKWTEPLSWNVFDDVGRKDLEDKNKRGRNITWEQILDREKEENTNQSQVKKVNKRIKRKVENIRRDLTKIRTYHQLMDLVETNGDLSVLPKKYKIDDLKISFDYPDHFKRRNQLYKKIKSLKKVESLVVDRLQSAEEQLNKSTKEFTTNSISPVAPGWNKVINKPTLKSTSTTKKDYKVFEFDKFKVAVGLSSKGNDSLRIEWAKKNDVWFHLDGDTSAHLILKSEELELNEQVFDIVGSIILEYSGHDYSHANLLYTRVKDLKGVKGTPGKVIYKKEKRYYAKKIDWTDFLLD
ncbi:MAG: hypothetical protein CME65_09545 [Halobacteriovoraceae bacterium]|nr:hypothetical protein [Halobacteriovoraceae bacterium]|tara:strand:- start:17061 stop:18389 length:1329 start_codon:yes stop_codon:yes gene_type:complete